MAKLKAVSPQEQMDYIKERGGDCGALTCNACTLYNECRREYKLNPTRMGLLNMIKVREEQDRETAKTELEEAAETYNDTAKEPANNWVETEKTLEVNENVEAEINDAPAMMEDTPEYNYLDTVQVRNSSEDVWVNRIFLFRSDLDILKRPVFCCSQYDRDALKEGRKVKAVAWAMVRKPVKYKAYTEFDPAWIGRKIYSRELNREGEFNKEKEIVGRRAGLVVVYNKYSNTQYFGIPLTELLKYKDENGKPFGEEVE